MLTIAQQKIIKRANKILEETLREYEVAFTSPDLVKTYLKTRLAMLEHEEFHLLLLNNQHKLIESIALFRGTIDGASVYPREIIKLVLEHNAAAVIIAHNHPSGISEPSKADLSITDKIKTALITIDVRLLDHIIVASECYSFAEHGLI